jgi:hypothetical protein
MLSPSRPAKVTVMLALAGGLTLGGAALANADTASPAPSTGTAPPARPAPSQYDAEGTITALSSSSLTLKTDAGTSQTYALTSSTTYRAGPEHTLKLTDLANGDRVHVRGAAATGGGRSALAVDRHPAHLDGTVTAVSGSTLTLIDRDGFRRVAHTTSSTTYTDGTAKATSSAVKVGEHLRAEGSVDADGTALDATTVAVNPPRPMGPGGPGGPEGHGPGRPGGGGPDGRGPQPPAAGSSPSVTGS